MNPTDSVTIWIDQLRAGQADAAQPLWERYFAKLVRLAGRRLSARVKGAGDEEDVALSAFKSFCRATQEGRFPQLQDRDDLWRLLATITEAKSKNHVRDQRRLKRGGGEVARVSELADGDAPPLELGLSREPSPEYAAELADQFQRLMTKLDDATLQDIVVRKLEGETKHEIADRLGVAVRTVERKLALIRSLWEAEAKA